MTSQIEFQGVDSEFPVAGRDNDTQGFRDNFSIIKNALGTAQSEITELQDSTAKLDQTNNYQGTTLIDANFEQSTATAFIGTISGDVELSFLNGHYQSYIINLADNDVTITLADFPVANFGQNRYASMRVQLSVPTPDLEASRNTRIVLDNLTGTGIGVGDTVTIRSLNITDEINDSTVFQGEVLSFQGNVLILKDFTDVDALISTVAIDNTLRVEGNFGVIAEKIIDVAETLETKTITWAAESGRIIADETWPQPFTLDTLVNYIPDSNDSTIKGPIVVEFWSYDGGNTIFAKYLGSFSAI